MKICAYCTTQNRDEAIFCSHCRRPLRGTPIPRDTSLIRLLAVLVLVGVGSYLFLTGPYLGPSASDGIQTPRPTLRRVRESVTVWSCVEDTTRIRRGPSTRDETIGRLQAGACLTIIGRTEDAGWVYMVSDDHQTGWVASHLLADTANIGKVSVRDNYALTNPARPALSSAEIAYGAQAYLTKVAATNIPGAPLSPYEISCFDTANRVGEDISCKIERAYCDYLPEVEGSPTFCNDRPHPDHNFALVVFGADWSEYDGQCIIVSGYLEIDRGVLQITALDRDQVSSCN